MIAGASGGAPETTQPGVTGVVVPCDEPGELAEAVVVLLDAPARRAEMGVHARARAVEQFEWTTLAERARSLLAPDTMVTP